MRHSVRMGRQDPLYVIVKGYHHPVYGSTELEGLQVVIRDEKSTSISIANCPHY